MTDNNTITFDDLVAAMKKFHASYPCKGKHKLTTPGYCQYCCEVWIGKQQADDLREFLLSNLDFKQDYKPDSEFAKASEYWNPNEWKAEDREG